MYRKSVHVRPSGRSAQPKYTHFHRWESSRFREFVPIFKDIDLHWNLPLPQPSLFPGQHAFARSCQEKQTG
jgi:hypothetical protein